MARPKKVNPPPAASGEVLSTRRLIHLQAADFARRNPKTSEVVAAEIIRNIASQNLQPGDRLPLEADMLVQYRVSRSSLREALRLLEVQGLIAIRPGPGSGTVVGRVSPAAFARMMTLHLHMMSADYDSLLSAWVSLEGTMASLAAQNPDRARVKATMAPFVADSHLQTVKSCTFDAAMDEAFGFHARVFDLADEPVLSLLTSSIGYIVTDQVLTSVTRTEMEDHIIQHHQLIAKAIDAGDAGEAHRLMTEHLNHVVDDFKAYWPRKIGERIIWR